MSGAERTSLLIVHEKKHHVGRDSEIASAVSSGSPEAFTKLYALYSPRLYKTIISITKNQADAEDVLQETFLRVHLALHTFEGRSSFYSWLTQIAINNALMVLRKRRTRPEILFDPQPECRAEDSIRFDLKDSAPNPEEVYDQHQRRATVLRAIGKLRPQLREPMSMKLMKESSLAEISKAMGISLASVKARLHRARLRLAETRDWKGVANRLSMTPERIDGPKGNCR